jgi:hypothetical protein
MLRLPGAVACTICASLLLGAAASASQFDFQADLRQIDVDSSAGFSVADFPYADLAKSLGIPNIPDCTDGALLAISIPAPPGVIVPAPDTSALSSAAIADVLDSFINISQIDPFASPDR